MPICIGQMQWRGQIDRNPVGFNYGTNTADIYMLCDAREHVQALREALRQDAAPATGYRSAELALRIATEKRRKRRRLQLPWRLCAKARAQELHQRHYLSFRHLRTQGRHGAAERAGRRPDAAPDHLDDTVGHRGLN